MSTPAAIIVKVKDAYLGIYCHFDGYPDRVGKMLKQYYNTFEKAESLVGLGDISSLGKTYENTVAYHRDRGEDLHFVQEDSWEDVVARIDGDYVYVFENGEWSQY
jgi:hypothetical protein